MARPVGVKEEAIRIPIYWRYDLGCEFSDSCLSCPFERCVEDLTFSERCSFGVDFRRDKAKDWRING